MNVLLSIKPKYVEEIIKGNKKYEFRKQIFKNRNIDRIYIYSSSPIKKIIGLFLVGEIVEDHPRKLWKEYKEFSGMHKDEFFNYFNGKEEGFAIEITDLSLFNPPIDPKISFSDFIPPQSFCYLNYSIVKIDQ